MRPGGSEGPVGVDWDLFASKQSRRDNKTAELQVNDAVANVKTNDIGQLDYTFGSSSMDRVIDQQDEECCN